MPWFSHPQRDSPDEIHAAHQALVYAGYPRSQAVAVFETYLYRRRAALAGPREIVSAGLVAGAAIASALTLLFGLAGFAMGVLSGPGIPVRGGDRGYRLIGTAAGSGTPAGATESWAEAALRSLLDILPLAISAAAILGLAGAGMALVTRRHWRRAGVLETFMDVAPGRAYLLEATTVWLGVAALILVIIRTQADSQMAEGAVIMLAFFGLPVLATVFAAAFPSLYKWLLPRVSPLDAAALARPIIELEAALKIKSDREASGRSTYHRTAYDRSMWADDVLARLDTARTARRLR